MPHFYGCFLVFGLQILDIFADQDVCISIKMDLLFIEKPILDGGAAKRLWNIGCNTGFAANFLHLGEVVETRELPIFILNRKRAAVMINVKSESLPEMCYPLRCIFFHVR